MSKAPKKGKKQSLPQRVTANRAKEADFDVVLDLIAAARKRAFSAVNTARIDLYWTSPVKLSTPLTELHPEAATVFKDSYLVEFLDLPKSHSESDLQQGLIENVKHFLVDKWNERYQ